MRVVAFLAAFLAGCAAFISVPPAPRPDNDFCAVPNFDGYEDEEGGYSLMLRSAQPTRGNIACLRDMYRLTDVFQLDVGRDPEVPGVVTHYRPLSVLSATSAQVGLVLEDMTKTCARPGAVCLVHCAHGQDRTGLVIALWLWHHVERTPENADRVYADMMRHGFHPYPALWKVFTQAVGW